MKKICLFTIVLVFGSGGLLSAQSSVNASGGVAAGTGSASYSAGQVFYTTIGTTVTVTQGVQQPYEISVVTGIERPEIILEMKTYPNPAHDFVILKIKDTEQENMGFSLYDVSGNLIRNDFVTGNETSVAMAGLRPGTYLMRVTQNGKAIKTFKIIKNQ